MICCMAKYYRHILSSTCLICMLALLQVSPILGQQGVFTQPALQDTLNEADTLINRNGFMTLFEGKPGKAALYGLLLPAGGQIYNRKWWKVPLALGIDGGLAYVLIYNTTSYRTAQADYVQALAIPGTGDIARLKAKRDFYRKWREYAWIWLLAGHLLTVADAYVDRHLMEFDVSPDLSQLTIPGLYSEKYVGLTFRIPIHTRTGTHRKKENNVFCQP